MIKRPKLVWKKSSKLKSSVFNDSDDEDEIAVLQNQQINSIKKKSGDYKIKCQQFKEQGSQLALDENYSEAILMWNKAISINPSDEKLYEMKAQVLMLQEEDFAAVKCAESAVSCNKLWSVSWLTLGRAQMNIKDFNMARLSFSRAVHLSPSGCECVEELNSIVDLLKKINS